MLGFPSAVYLLCVATSLACTALLIRTYLQNRTPLLLWSALGFIGLSINNFFLFIDLIVFPEVDLAILRQLTALAGLSVLLYGFIWEVD
jgi:uncharacterized membrane protein